MGTIKRFLSVLMAVVMLACAVPVIVQAGTNGHSQSDAVNWANSKNGQSLDYDGVYGAQCVDFTAYYYQYLGAAAYVGGNANAYQTRSIPDGWSRIYYSSGITFQPGDIAVWKTNLSWQNGYSTTSTGDLGHIGIILSADSVGFNAAEQNAGGKQYVTINWHYNSELFCVIRPNWNANPFSAVNASWVSDNNATLEAALDRLYYCTSVGFYIGTNTSYMIKHTEVTNTNVQNIWYTLIGDCGITLTHATKYYYKFFAVIGGSEFLSEVKTFTTTGSHNYNIVNITKAATCISTGTKTMTCACGESKTGTVAINPNNHVNTKNVAATASSCTKKGYTAGVYCNDCKKYISGHAEQPLAAHQTTLINAKEASYTEEGYTGDEYCTVCKQTVKTGTVIPKLEEGDDPTQQAGICSWCGNVHQGILGLIVAIFHRIFAIFFGARYE